MEPTVVSLLNLENIELFKQMSRGSENTSLKIEKISG
jgi:hypothetical protein